jgi:hypothetical protein
MVEETLSMIRNVSVPYIEAEDCKDVNLHAFKIVNTKAMFVSRKVVSRKPLSKLPHVCLSLEKLVNEKHFPVKEKFSLIFRKVFFFLAVFVFRKVISGKSLSKLSCVCLLLGKLVNEKHFPVNGKFGLVFRKVFS